MKEYLLGTAIFGSIILFVFSLMVIPVTLLNTYFIFGSVLIFGAFGAVLYFILNKKNVQDSMDYIYIPIRSTITFGSIITFTFILLNYHLRETEILNQRIPVVSKYLDESIKGGKFSNKLVIRSAFVINYKGQTKNIIWNKRLEDSIMNNVTELVLEVNNGFCNIDVLESARLIVKSK